MTKQEYCKRGHKRTPDNLIGRTCKECHALAERKRKTHCLNGHPRNPDNLYYNGQCKECAKTKAKQWCENNPSKRKKIARISLWKLRYGLTEEAYNKILNLQGGLCAICKKPPVEGKMFIVDHDHSCCPTINSCGKCVRGLIHQRCNSALGTFLDNPEICRNAANYLENPPTKSLIL
jgi:hypothetical protein